MEHKTAQNSKLQKLQELRDYFAKQSGGNIPTRAEITKNLDFDMPDWDNIDDISM